MTTATGVVLTVDTPITSLAEIEHALFDLCQQVRLPVDAHLCTHAVRHERPHYVVTLTVGDDAVLRSAQQHLAPWVSAVSYGKPSATTGYSLGLRQGTREAIARDGGRAVRFPGWETVRGSLAVGDVLASTAITRLEVLGGGSARGDDVLHSRDFVRPLWRHGDLVLPVLPAGRGAVAPFEVPNPTACCGDHA